MNSAALRETTRQFVAGVIRSHLATQGDQRRWVAPSSTGDPSVTISLIASEDRGTHASGWWRNSDYDRCWHLSLCAMENRGALRAQFADLPPADRTYWPRAVFGSHLDLAWIEPPASKLDPHRHAPASAYTTHVRVFLDQGGHPIRPEGEVYTLKPWTDGTSPEKVHR